MRDKTIPWLLIVLLLVPKTGFAAEFNPGRAFTYPSSQDLIAIPKLPSQPPGLLKKEIPGFPHCERYFLFEGKAIECDSNLGRDAERLRSIVHDVPQAIHELDIYQENLRNVRVSGYLITSAVLLIALGLIFSGGKPFDPANGGITPGGAVFMGGATLGVASALHGFTLVNSNETHIQRAVDYYNGAHPENRIELQFSTGIGAKLIQ